MHWTRPLGQSAPALQARLHQALTALDGLTADEQLEVACQLVVGVLRAARRRFESSQEDRATYDTLCDTVEEWFRAEIGPLRFARPH
jgi:uncharacterized membrane protein